jgi:hypothetical protein
MNKNNNDMYDKSNMEIDPDLDMELPLIDPIRLSKLDASVMFTNTLETEQYFFEFKKKLEDSGISITENLLYKLTEDGLPIYNDTVNTYKYNSYGYRSPEYDGSAELLFAGCSNTFGTGLPEEAIWGSQLANNLNMKYANISKQGASVSWIVKNIFAYLNEVGHPKIICCLFPDFLRLMIPIDPRDFTSAKEPSSNNNSIKKSSDGNSRESSNKIIHTSIIYGGGHRVVPEYSKRPHLIETMIPPNFTMFLAIQDILRLKMYCESNNIKFLWSTWELSTLNYLFKLKNKYPRDYENLFGWKAHGWKARSKDEGYGDFYAPSEQDHINNVKMSIAPYTPLLNEDCHIDLKHKYGTNFYRGLDEIHGIDSTHFGIHKHAHIADGFLSAISTNG